MTTMTVIGCGLIGGSMALSWKKAGIVDHVIAYGLNPERLEKTKKLGVADEVTTDIEEAVKKGDIVVVSVPVLAMPQIFEEVGKYLRPDALVTDVGSTRTFVIRAALKGLGDKFRRYAPGHPIAGGELPGVEQATDDLFDKKIVISTPTEHMDKAVVEKLENWWRKVGSVVQRMTPELHDEVFASVSHLPHVLAYGLVDMITKEAQPDAKLKMAGAGFRDFTRIAASSPVMWRDICLTNKEAISKELSRYRKELERLQEYIDAGDGKAIEACFENAMRNRRGLVFPGK